MIVVLLFLIIWIPHFAWYIMICSAARHPFDNSYWMKEYELKNDSRLNHIYPKKSFPKYKPLAIITIISKISCCFYSCFLAVYVCVKGHDNFLTIFCLVYTFASLFILGFIVLFLDVKSLIKRKNN